MGRSCDERANFTHSNDNSGKTAHGKQATLEVSTKYVKFVVSSCILNKGSSGQQPHCRVRSLSFLRFACAAVLAAGL
jgi:hypothetical protein